MDVKKPVTQSKPSENIEDYFPIPIYEFISGPALKYDLYIRLGESNFVKIAGVGTKMDKDRIETYKKKGVESLYLTTEDYKSYLLLNIKNTESMTSQAKDRDTWTRLFGNINSMLNNLAFSKDLDEVTYNKTKAVCVKTYQLISDNSQLIGILDMLCKTSDTEIFHATAVSFVSSLLCGGLSYTYSTNAHKLILAGMFHDIGKKNMGPDILQKSPLAMSNAELKQYQRHTIEGRDILIEVKSIHSDIIEAVYEHHEALNGTGFPNGIKGSRIHPLARVLKVADDFCNYMYPKKGIQIRSLYETLTIMSSVKANEYDADIIKSLLKYFGKEKK
jgi:HD-GYP domain-containing protein (c-di-GMP phosphodiesterase class II)